MSTTSTVTTRLLATLCRVCPLCICARWWPKSRFAQALREIEGSCPACKAYAKLRKEA